MRANVRNHSWHLRDRRCSREQGDADMMGLQPVPKAHKSQRSGKVDWQVMCS